MLLYRPNPKEMLGLAQLSRVPSLEALTDVFKAELMTTQSLMVKADMDSQLRQLQGRAQLLQGFLDVLEQARRKDSPL
jgi:hypothetical protein